MQCAMRGAVLQRADCGARQSAAAQIQAAVIAPQSLRRPALAMHGVVSRLTRPAAASSLLQRPARLQRRQQRLEVANTYPEPETEKERSPIDYPQEWITPQPSRRPDIFPEFEKLQTPMPKPMPGDPEMPDEEEEEEKEKKPDKEDPDEDKPKPDEPAPSEE